MNGVWVYEAPDPAVGFLTDDLTHACTANVEADTYDVRSAEVADVIRMPVWSRARDGSEVQVVAETTVYRCPPCGATTTSTVHWPLWFFEQPDGA